MNIYKYIEFTFHFSHSLIRTATLQQLQQTRHIHLAEPPQDGSDRENYKVTAYLMVSCSRNSSNWVW